MERKNELRIPPPSGELKRPVPPLPPTARAETRPAGAQDLSTVQLVKEITAEVTQLASKQIELAKTELKADLKAEATAVGGLFLAGLTGLCTINLLLVTAVLALATAMPGWGAGLLISGVTLAVTAVIGWTAWSKRVRKPMERTQRTLKEDVQWTKERLA